MKEMEQKRKNEREKFSTKRKRNWRKIDANRHHTCSIATDVQWSNLNTPYGHAEANTHAINK